MELKPATQQAGHAPFWRRLAGIVVDLLEARANRYRLTPPQPPRDHRAS